LAAPVAARSDKRALYLVDSSIYVFRGWHTLPGTIVDADGRPANAVHGFIEFLYQLISRRRPQLLACAFDESLTSSGRNSVYPDYKANRPPAPDDLKNQFRHCKEFVQAIGIAAFASNEVEADDIIGTLAGHAQAQNIASVIVSADKDLCQFVGPHDALWDFAKDVWLDARLVEKRFGVRPSQVADLLAICGDKVDNIPGVPGVGIATAARLLVKWGNVDNLLANVDKVAEMKFRGAVRVSALVAEHADTIRLSRRLTGLWTDDTLDADCSALTINPDNSALREVFERLQMGEARRERWYRLLAQTTE
jgi:5'-3' exonuclease